MLHGKKKNGTRTVVQRVNHQLNTLVKRKSCGCINAEIGYLHDLDELEEQLLSVLAFLLLND